MDESQWKAWVFKNIRGWLVANMIIRMNEPLQRSKLTWKQATRNMPLLKHRPKELRSFSHYCYTADRRISERVDDERERRENGWRCRLRGITQWRLLHHEICETYSPSDVAALNAERTNAPVATLSRWGTADCCRAMTNGEVMTIWLPVLLVLVDVPSMSCVELEGTNSPATNTAPR